MNRRGVCPAASALHSALVSALVSMLVCVLLAMSCGSARALTDEMQLHRITALGIALRWVAIDGPPYLLPGPTATAGTVASRGPRVTELIGDGQVSLHLPARAWLRIVADAPGKTTPPQVAVSNGTGVAVTRRLEAAADGRSWLLRVDASHAVVVHVGRAAGAPERQRLTFYLARFDVAPDATTYRNELHSPGEPAFVRRADEASPRRYTRLAATSSVDLEVVGPDRLLIETRIETRSDTDEPPGNTVTVVKVAIDGQAAEAVRELTGPEAIAPVQVDGRWTGASRLQRLFVNVLPGKHRVSLTASHPVLLRVTTAREPDLLLPKRNLPPAWRELKGGTAVAELEQTVIAASVSNRWRNIGSLAAGVASRQAEAVAGAVDLRRWADAVEDQFTDYRDLAPDDAAPAGARPQIEAASFIARVPQPPDDRPLVQIATEGRPPALPVSLFHRPNATGTRYLLPQATDPVLLRVVVLEPLLHPAEVEMDYDNGSSQRILIGTPELPGTSLQAGGLAGAVPNDAWPATLGGAAARSGQLAALRTTGAAEWHIPHGVRSLRLRVLHGTTAIALQWRQSIEYRMDDQALAVIARLPPRDSMPPAATELVMGARRPLDRLTAAACAQVAANVLPVATGGPSVDEASARSAARAAATEPDPARAFERWQWAMRSADRVLRAASVRGQAQALASAGERGLMEHLLRAYSLSDDAAVAGAAGDELNALYARENDLDAQLLQAAARACREPSQLPALAVILGASGDHELAIIAGLLGSRGNPDTLLQDALLAGYRTTFDALLGHVTADSAASFWRAQRALSDADLAAARRHFEAAGASEWIEAMDAGQRISADLLSADGTLRAAAVGHWLSWQKRHPGPRLWRDEPAALRAHGGSLPIRSVARDLRSQWWRATAATPLVVQVAGPVKLRIEVRPLHTAEQSLLAGWLEVRSAGQRWVQPFDRNRPAAGLVLDGQTAQPGEHVAREIELPAGLHTLTVDAGTVAVAARMQVERPALQIPVLPVPAAAHFFPTRLVTGIARPAPLCGWRYGCTIRLDGDPEASLIDLEEAEWAGLPPVEPGTDPIALLTASGSFAEAAMLADDPLEQMRLLALLGEGTPAQRARALALGAAIARSHPRADVQAIWTRLQALGSWTALALVDRSAGLRAVEYRPGDPVSPGTRIRAALLAPLRHGEVRITADQRAALGITDLRATTTTLEIAAEALPGDPPLPLVVVIEVDGKPVRTLRLVPSDAPVRVPVRLPAGRHDVAVTLREPYPNQFARVRFGQLGENLPAVTRDWQIATRIEAVRATVQGPAWVRIDSLHPEGVRSEEKLLPDRVATLVLAPLAGNAETLYRVNLLRLAPRPAPPFLVRPDLYRPQPVAEAPEEWWPPAAPDRFGSVRFVDAIPLDQLVDRTLSTRLIAGTRQEPDAYGAGPGIGPQRHVEIGSTLRRRNERGDRGVSADIFVRQTQGASPVLGVRGQVFQAIDWTAVFARPLDVSAMFLTALQSTSAGTGAAIEVRLGVSQRREITPELAHAPFAQTFARLLTLRHADAQDQVDPDVYTPYRAARHAGLEIGDLLSWSPWRDTRLSAGAQVAVDTGPAWPGPDRVAVHLRGAQLVGPVLLEAGIQRTRFLGESSGSASPVRHVAHVDAGWERWLGNGTRIELRAGLRRDLGAGQSWGAIDLRWHYGPGRALRDFADNELEFRSLRTWRVPVEATSVEAQLR